MRFVIQIFLLFVYLTIQSCGGSSGGDIVDPVNTITVSLSGKVEYQDKVYNQNGFVTGNEPMKPVRFAVVDIVNASDVIVDSTVSDDSGNYQIDVSVAVGDYNVRVLSRTLNASGHHVNVENFSKQVYAASSAFSVLSDTATLTHNVSIDLASGISGAFNIMDVFTSGMAFVDNFSNTPQWMLSMTGYWENGVSSYGSYTCTYTDASFCPNGSGVYVLSGNDSDEYDDDVLWHEFSHYVEFALSQFDTPGGVHTFSDNTLDLRLAWSEGHADYLQVAIKEWLRLNDPQRLSIPPWPIMTTNWYVDTRGSTTGVVLDLGSLSAGSFLYSSSEAAVASVLMGLKDFTGIQSNWDVLTGALTINTTTADTLESFWDGYYNQQTLGLDSATLLTNWNQWQSILGAHEINYKLDSHEIDDTDVSSNTRIINCEAINFSVGTNCIDAEEHFLFKGTSLRDADVTGIQLTAGTNYKIFTHNLKNGADTNLVLYDDLGNVVDENDEAIAFNGTTNIHDGTHFASSITFNPTVTGTYYVDVSTAPDVFTNMTVYGYIGRYGTYSLTVGVVP